MSWLTKTGTLILGLALLLGTAAADEAEKTPQTVPSGKPTTRAKPKVPPKAVRRDTEGTEAHDRFEAEISIPSHYTLDGKPLEVDPD